MEDMGTRFKAALYLRDYDAANRVIAATPAKFAFVYGPGQPPESWADGQVALARGDKQKAQAVFAAARKTDGSDMGRQAQGLGILQGHRAT